nr:MAG TPA: hypothetical protein [Caudoviricetes sp.]
MFITNGIEIEIGFFKLADLDEAFFFFLLFIFSLPFLI